MAGCPQPDSLVLKCPHGWPRKFIFPRRGCEGPPPSCFRKRSSQPGFADGFRQFIQKNNARFFAPKLVSPFLDGLLRILLKKAGPFFVDSGILQCFQENNTDPIVCSHALVICQFSFSVKLPRVVKNTTLFFASSFPPTSFWDLQVPFLSDGSCFQMTHLTPTSSLCEWVSHNKATQSL